MGVMKDLRNTLGVIPYYRVLCAMEELADRLKDWILDWPMDWNEPMNEIHAAAKALGPDGEVRLDEMFEIVKARRCCRSKFHLYLE